MTISLSKHIRNFAPKLLIAAVIIIAVTLSVIYTHHNSTPLNDELTASSEANATAGWSTYTSNSGNFSFKYPTNWSATENESGPSQSEIIVQPTAAQASTTNSLRMTLFVTKTPDASYQPAAAPNGTVQALPNGIDLWTSNSDSASRPTANGTGACPVVEIINSTQTHFSYALSDGQYLSLEGGYCLGQNDTSSQDFQTQLSSSDWNTATEIISSIAFN